MSRIHLYVSEESPEAEKHLIGLEDPGLLVSYARFIAKRRIPEFEEIIARRDITGSHMYRYAIYVAKRRMPKFEQRIAETCSDCHWMLVYGEHVAKCRVPVFEEALLARDITGWKMANYMMKVAKCVIPEFEDRIFESPSARLKKYYVENVVRRRVPRFERIGISTGVFI